MNIFNIISGILMIMSGKCEEVGDRASFFNEYKTVPSSYFDITSKEGPQTIKSEIFHGHVVRTVDNRKVVVTEMFDNGKIRYFERSLFNTGAIDITDKMEEIIYSGSIENCWYKWYLYQHQ